MRLLLKRLNINAVLDAAALAVFALLGSSGLVLRYLLPPGSGRLVTQGVGNRALERPVTLLWGMTRHQWGDIHFWLAVAFLAIIACHLALHWRWMVCIVKGNADKPPRLRLAAALLGLSLLAAVSAAPFFSARHKISRADTMEERAVQDQELPAQAEKDEHGSLDIRGSMTLQEAADTAGVPVRELIERLGLPKDVSPDERIGRLRRRFGFELTDIRKALKNGSAAEER